MQDTITNEPENILKQLSDINQAVEIKIPINFILSGPESKVFESIRIFRKVSANQLAEDLLKLGLKQFMELILKDLFLIVMTESTKTH